MILYGYVLSTRTLTTIIMGTLLYNKTRLYIAKINKIIIMQWTVRVVNTRYAFIDRRDILLYYERCVTKRIGF